MNFDAGASKPHHILSFSGLTPWRFPGVLRMRDVQADPAARCCRECGARLLLLLLRSSSWVAHRTEHVTFRDDRSVVRQVTVELDTPPDAPVFLGDDGQPYCLVPLSIMRRKTLVNFTLSDGHGQPVVLPSLRQNQAITESMLLACASATLACSADGASCAGAAEQREIGRFIHQVVSGDQRELTAAYRSLARETATPAVLHLFGQYMFQALLHRLADNFVLWVMIPAGAPRRRVLTFSCDEPLQLHYRKSGFTKERAPGKEPGSAAGPDAIEDVYGLGDKLPFWRPVVFCSALGLTATRVRFPVPAAENTDSFHFEIDAPKGIQVVEASLLAGRPGHLNPSFDRVEGGFPTVGLHVIEVPNGSLCRAQIGLQVVTRGWLMTSMLSAWAVFGLLVACARFPGSLQPDSGAPALILVGVAAGVAALIAKSATHGLAAHLLKWARTLAAVSAALPLIVATSAVLQPRGSQHVVHVLWIAIATGGAIALLLTAVCLLSWWRQRKSTRSPWEQSHVRTDMPPQPRDFRKAIAEYHYDKPAMRVDSAEGWHTEFRWTEAVEDELIEALSKQYPDHSSPHYVGADRLVPA